MFVNQIDQVFKMTADSQKIESLQRFAEKITPQVSISKLAITAPHSSCTASTTISARLLFQEDMVVKSFIFISLARIIDELSMLSKWEN